MKTQNLKGKFFVTVAFIWLSFPGSAAFAQSIVKPQYSYLKEFSFKNTSLVKLNGSTRMVSFGWRKGLNMASIHIVLQLKGHIANQLNLFLFVLKWLLCWFKLQPDFASQRVSGKMVYYTC